MYIIRVHLWPCALFTFLISITDNHNILVSFLSKLSSLSVFSEA